MPNETGRYHVISDMLLQYPYFLSPPQYPSPFMSHDFLQPLAVIIPRSSRPLCPAVPFHLFLISLKSLGVGNAHPGRPAATPARPTHVPAAAAPVSPFLPCSCPMLRTSRTRWGAALLSHVFPHWSTFLSSPQENCQEKKKICFCSLPKNLFLLSVPCYARPLLTN